MRFKKIISFAAAAVVAAGICISTPTGEVGSPLAVITTEAASSKYPEFPVTENGDGTVTVKKNDGSKIVGTVTNYYHGRIYSNGEYSQSHITILIKETKLENGDRLCDYLVIFYNPKNGTLTYSSDTVVNSWAYVAINAEGDYVDKYVKDDWLLGKELSGKIEALDYYGDGGDIVIPEGVTDITSNLFDNDDRITSVTFPKSFNDYCGMFKNCKNLKKVEVKGNASFTSESFKDCTNLESVIIRGKLYGSIGSSAFENCTSLETFKIYKMVYANEGSGWNIGEKAFKNCQKLAAITIPNNCGYIGNEAFKNCFSLETVKISGGCDVGPTYDFTILESAFENCYSLKSINILSRCDSIKEKAFLNCYNLAELKIPEKTWLRDYSVGYIYKDKKYVVADGKKSVTYTNAEGEKVKVTPKQITLTLTNISNAEISYANVYNIKYKYTDGTSPSSIPAPKASIRAYISDNYDTTKYLTIDTSDRAAFYRIYKRNKDFKYEFYKDVTSANDTLIEWGTYVVVAYYKNKDGSYTASRPTNTL